MKTIHYILIVLVLFIYISCSSFEDDYDPRDHNPVDLKLEPEDTLFVLEPENWIDFQLIRIFESGRRENLLSDLNHDTTRDIYLSVDNDTTINISRDWFSGKIEVSPKLMKWGIWERYCSLRVRYVELNSNKDSVQWYFNKPFIIRQNLFPANARTVLIKDTVVIDLDVGQNRGFFYINWVDSVQGQQFFRIFSGTVENGPTFFAREYLTDPRSPYLNSELKGIWLNQNYATCTLIDSLNVGIIDTTFCTMVRIN